MKKERWIRETHLFRPDEYTCPVCGADYRKPYRRCPRCGTAMDAEGADLSWLDEAEEMAALLDDDW